MSSNIKVKRICVYCSSEFVAQTTSTKYCSKKCNSAHYNLEDDTATNLNKNDECTLIDTEKEIERSCKV